MYVLCYSFNGTDIIRFKSVSAKTNSKNVLQRVQKITKPESRQGSLYSHSQHEIRKKTVTYSKFVTVSIDFILKNAIK